MTGQRPVTGGHMPGFWPIAVAIMGVVLTAGGTASAAGAHDSDVDRAMRAAWIGWWRISRSWEAGRPAPRKASMAAVAATRRR